MKFQLKLTIFIFWATFPQGGFFRSGGGGVAAAIQFCVFGLVCNGSGDIWGWLWFSCGIARLISVFQEFSASMDKPFVLAGGGGGVAPGL